MPWQFWLGAGLGLLVGIGLGLGVGYLLGRFARGAEAAARATTVEDAVDKSAADKRDAVDVELRKVEDTTAAMDAKELKDRKSTRLNSSH